MDRPRQAEHESELLERKGPRDVFWPFGTMPDLPEYLKAVNPFLGFLDMILRGAAQVCFMNNPITGIFVIVALVINNPQTAAYGVLSLITSTATAVVLKGYDACTSGLFGFNGILTGTAISMFFHGDYLDSHIALVAVICIVFGMMSSVVAISLGKWFRAHGLPGLTFPFNICTLWLLGGALSYPRWEMSGLLKPHLLKQTDVTRCLREAADGSCENQLMAFFIAALRGISEIYLANDTTAAILMIIGFAICSPLASALLFVGSAIGAGMGAFLGLDGAFLYGGLFGFNPALTAAGIGAGIFGDATPTAVLWGLIGAIVTPFLQGTIANYFSPAGMPTFTLPFCFTTLLLLGADIIPKADSTDDGDEEDEEKYA